MWDVRGLRPIRALELWLTRICENQSKTCMSLKLRNLKKSAVGKNCFSAVGMAIARVKTGSEPVPSARCLQGHPEASRFAANRAATVKSLADPMT